MNQATSGSLAAAAGLAIALLGARPSIAADSLPWEKSFRAASIRAKNEGKLIMVDFWATWCKYCEKLDQTTYKDPSVIARLAKTTVPVKVNTEGRRDELELADEHGIEGLPTIGFFTAEGRAVARINGYTDARAFIKLLTTAEVEGAEMMAWEKSLRANPNDFKALFGLGSKMYELDYQDNARPMLEKARRIDLGSLRERKRVRMMLARIIETRSSFTDSEAMLREGLALPPEPDTDPRLQFLLARCLVTLGKGGEGKAELKKLIAAYPNHPVTAAAKKTLEDVK